VAEALVEQPAPYPVGPADGWRGAAIPAPTSTGETTGVPSDFTPVALGPYVEPVHLQIVCRQLWENLRPSRDDRGRRCPGVRRCRRGADRFLSFGPWRERRRTGARERSLRAWFSEQLITSADTRGLVYQGETETAGLANAAVNVLNNAYVIRAVRAGANIW